MLRILLLGIPLVSWDEKTTLIQRKVQRALLYYLACQTKPVSRAELMLLFWPDTADIVARRHLREALSKLRAELPDKNLLVIDREQVSLDRKRIWVDAVEFRSVSSRVWNPFHMVPPSTALPDTLATDLERAVNLWHGEHFLEGASLPSTVPFDRWLDTQTDELDYIRQEMLERLGFHHAATGDLVGGIYYLRLALKNDELNEALHLQVLTWLQAMGKRTDALDYCKDLKKIFSEETGQILPPALENMYQNILTESGAISYPTPSQAWPVYPDLNIPFVGRAEVLQSLQRAFRRGGTVFISGETGAGKTRLARQLFLSLQPEPRLLLAVGRPAGRNLPFQPLIDMLRSSILPEEWQQLPDVWAGKLAWILPELLALRPEISAPAYDMQAARSFIFEALRQLLLQITHRRRVLLFLDDAHWSDESTLSALAYLQSHDFFNHNGLLVLAARLEDHSDQLQEYLTNIQRQTALERYLLSELEHEDVSTLCRFMLGQPPTPQVVERLMIDTGGNPLFLVETLRALLDRMPNPTSINWMGEIPLAGGITNLVQIRLRGLSARSRQLIAAAAVCGPCFTPNLLEIVLRQSPEEVAADLDELEQRHLIRPKGDERNNRYCFIHDVFREVLQRELTPARRRLLHMRVAQAKEAPAIFPAEGANAVLAGHYQAAGMPAQACQHWILAADYARRLFSRTEALAAYRSAEELLRHDHHAIPDELIRCIYTGLGDLDYEIMATAEMLEDYTILLHYGEQRNSPLLIGSAYSGRALYFFTQGEMQAAQEEIEYGVRYLSMAGHNEELMLAFVRRGTIWHNLLRLNEAAAEYERVVEMGHGHFGRAVTRLAAVALDRLALIQHAMGWPQKTMETADHSLRHSRVLGFTNDSVATYLSLAMASDAMGEYEAALEYARKGLEQAYTNHRFRFAGHLHKVCTHVLLKQGRLDECWEQLEKMDETIRRYAPVEMKSDRAAVYGDFYLEMDRLAEAEQAFLTAVQEGGPNSLSWTYARLHVGVTRGVSGDLSGGLAITGEVIEFVERVGYGRILLPARLTRGGFLRLQGALSQARQDLEWTLEQARARGLYLIQLLAQVQLGYLKFNEGKAGEAKELAGAVIRTASAMGNRLSELGGLRLARTLDGDKNRDGLAAQKRMVEILNEMDRNARSAAIRPHFLHFRDHQLDIKYW